MRWNGWLSAVRDARTCSKRSGARTAKRQDKGRWRVDGVDLDGDDLSVIVALDGTVVAIITVM